ncbi:MAG: P-loop NTPase [Marmoricola sp.]
MPVLVEADATTAGVLAPTLASGTHVVTGSAEVLTWLQRRDDYVVVVGPTFDATAAAALADQVRSQHPATTVVLIRHMISPDVYARAMQHGIGAVVAADDPAALTAAVQRARQNWEAIHGPSSKGNERQGRVLTVFSPKGGVGKTTMAVNLGLALVKRHASVCLLDLDLAFGDIAITLQLIPDHTIAEAADAEEHLDYALLHTLLTRHESSLMILAAPTHPEGREHIPASLVRRVITTLRSHFDFVIIDTPPGFDDQVLGALDETDEVIVVATLDVPTIKNTKVALETLDLLGLLRNNRHLVLNRADEEVGLSRGNVEDILAMKVTVSLPSDIAVASATNHGQPIVVSKPDHPVSRAITNLATTLSGDQRPAEGPASTKRGLFARVRKH